MGKKFTTILMAAVTAASGMAMAAIPESSIPTGATSGNARKLPTFYKETRRLNPATEKPAEMIRPGQRVMMPTSPIRKSPLRITDGGTDIYGWAYYGDPTGMYRVVGKTAQLYWADKFVETAGWYTISEGWLKDGRLYGYAPNQFNGQVSGLDMVVYDFNNGDILETESLEMNCYFDRLAYNPKDDYVYGFGMMWDVDPVNYVYMKAPASNPGAGEFIANIPDYTKEFRSICYNAEDGLFYGVSGEGTFCSIDTEGNYTELFSLGLDPMVWNSGYKSGIVYSQAEGCYFWNNVTWNEDWSISINLSKIDPAKQTLELYCTLPEEFYFFVSPDDVSDDTAAPRISEMGEVSFANGSLTGRITYQTPTATIDGETLAGDIDVYAELDGTPYAGPIACAPGEKVTFDYTELDRGMHVFSEYTIADGHKSPVLTREFFIGVDTPSAPARVTFHQQETVFAVWDEVTTGAHGGYIDLEDLSYNVYINGEFYGKSDTFYLDNIVLPDDVTMSLYSASVTAVSGGYESTPTYSNEIAYGKPFDLPLEIKPTLEQAKICYSIDANQDGNCWLIDEAEQAFIINYPPYGDAQDDWLILPPVNITDTEKYYPVEFLICKGSAFWPESLEVFAGTSPESEDMTIELISDLEPSITYPAYQKVSALLKVEEPGAYYIGFHCNSGSDNYGLKLKDISVADNNVTAASPDYASNVDIEAAEEGELQAYVQFSFPTRTISGQSLPEGAVLKATIEGYDTVEIEGTPGSRGKATVETDQGDNSISIQISLGELNGPKMMTTVYTGIDVPVAISDVDVEASADMQSMKITWKAPTEGVNGGYVNPAGIYYNIFKAIQTPYGTQYEQIATTEEGVTEYEYTFDPATSEFQMDQVLLAIQPADEAGVQSEMTLAGAVLGTPYALPMYDNFEDGFNLNPWLVMRPGDEYLATYGIYQLNQIGGFENYEGAALAVMGNDGEKGRLELPRFATTGIENAMIKLDMYTGHLSANTTLYGYTYGTEDAPVEIATINVTPDNEEFHTVILDLPAELIGKEWVQVYIENSFTGEQVIMLVKSIEVSEGSSVAELADTRSVIAGKGTVILTGFEGNDVNIYRIDGTSAASLRVADHVKEVTLDKGIYLIKTNDRTYKVIVK